MSTLFGDIRLRCPALRHVLLPDDAWPLVLTAVAAVRARPPRLRNYLAERCRRCGALHERAIVPPTMKAVFSSHPRLGYLWALAFDALAAARRVIVIGVSFAPSDYLLRWLLRATLNAAQDFIVVDIDREGDVLAFVVRRRNGARAGPATHDGRDGSHCAGRPALNAPEARNLLK